MSDFNRSSTKDLSPNPDGPPSKPRWREAGRSGLFLPNFNQRLLDEEMQSDLDPSLEPYMTERRLNKTSEASFPSQDQYTSSDRGMGMAGPNRSISTNARASPYPSGPSPSVSTSSYVESSASASVYGIPLDVPATTLWHAMFTQLSPSGDLSMLSFPALPIAQHPQSSLMAREYPNHPSTSTLVPQRSASDRGISELLNAPTPRYRYPATDSGSYAPTHASQLQTMALPHEGSSYSDPLPFPLIPEEQHQAAVQAARRSSRSRPKPPAVTMSSQWKAIYELAVRYYGRNYICIVTHLVKERPPFGGPGNDLTFEEALRLAIQEVVGNGKFLPSIEYLAKRLPLVYDIIPEIYNAGTTLFDDNISLYYPAFLLADCHTKFTNEWHIARRNIAADLQAAPGGFLHLQVAGELQQYQNPGLLAFIEAFMFKGYTSFGAANPGFFSTLQDGLLALIVAIAIKGFLRLSQNPVPTTPHTFVSKDVFDTYIFHRALISVVRTDALEAAISNLIKRGTITAAKESLAYEEEATRIKVKKQAESLAKRRYKKQYDLDKAKADAADTGLINT